MHCCPKTLHDRYQDCVDTLDTEWLATLYKRLSDQQRAEFSFERYRASQILDEIGTRATLWLNRGLPGRISQEPAARPLLKERTVAAWLSFHGFNVEFGETRSAASKKTSDIYIGHEMWEIKQPTGNGKQTIYHQFEEAARQCNRLVLDVSEVVRPEAGDRWNVKTVERAVKKLIGWHYKSGGGITVQFAEVMLIDGSYLKRIKKGS